MTGVKIDGQQIESNYCQSRTRAEPSSRSAPLRRRRLIHKLRFADKREREAKEPKKLVGFCFAAAQPSRLNNYDLKFDTVDSA